MFSILITGKDGQLGRELLKNEPPSRYRCIYTDIGELNLMDHREVIHFNRHNKFNLIINCAAYTAVDRAEKERDEAMRINCTAVENLVGVASNEGIPIIHLSTDFVFDGTKRSPYTEEDHTNPLSVYGESKLAGERFVVGYRNGWVLRTSWLYSEWGTNFVKTILRLAGEKNEIKVVNDQIGTPTYAGDLAKMIWKMTDAILDRDTTLQPGLYHYSNEGSVSWFDFASEICRLASLEINILPVPTSEYPLPAARPPYSVLSKEKIKKHLGLSIINWQESLQICIDNIINSNRS